MRALQKQYLLKLPSPSSISKLPAKRELTRDFASIARITTPVALHMANIAGTVGKPDAAWVANEFVKRYYEVLAKHPKYLNRFYKEESQFTLTIRNHGAPETRQTVSTTQAIQDKVNSTVQGAKITIEHSEAQYSLQSGVLLQVDGRLVLPNEVEERRYTQIFFLAPQDKGFFVLNDILCLHPTIAVDLEAAASAEIENGYHPSAPAAESVAEVQQQAVMAAEAAQAEMSQQPQAVIQVAQQQPWQQQAHVAAETCLRSQETTNAGPLAAHAELAGSQPSGGVADVVEPTAAAPQHPGTTAAAPAAADLGPATPTAAEPQQQQPAQQQQPQEPSQQQQETANASPAVPLSYAQRVKMSLLAASGGSATRGAGSAGASGSNASSSSGAVPSAADATPAAPAALQGPNAAAGSSTGWADTATSASGGATAVGSMPADADQHGAEPAGIFLRGIPGDTTREQLIGLFQEYGPIVNVSIVPSRTHDTNTAYVDFEQEASAQKALSDYGKKALVLGGVIVTVLPKIPKTQRIAAGMGVMGGRGGGRGTGPGDFRRSGSTGTFGGRSGAYAEGGRGRGRNGDGRGSGLEGSRTSSGGGGTGAAPAGGAPSRLGEGSRGGRGGSGRGGRSTGRGMPGEQA